MGRQRLSQKLNLFMNGIRVGHLQKFKDGSLYFQYEQEWLERAPNLPISRKFPLRAEPFKGDIVHHYFDNLLPDNQNVRQLLAQKTKAESADPFDLLSVIGRDCVGALQLIPDKVSIPSATNSSKPASPAEIATLLTSLHQTPLGINFNLHNDFRISIAGAQEKTALLKKAGEWHIPIGSTPTTHIFKVQMGMINNTIDMSHSVENEWLTMMFCKAFKLPTAEVEIGSFNQVKALIVTRFDRLVKDGAIFRIPQEDFCQVHGLSSAQKYESDGGPGIPEIMEILKESDRAECDRATFMRSQVVFWVLAAIDGHAKNFSLQPGASGFILTPLYDVMSAFPVFSKKEGLNPHKVKMAMAVGKNRHYRMNQITRRHWLETAKICGFSEDQMNDIINDIVEIARHALTGVKKLVPKDFPSQIAQAIFDGIKAQIEKLEK